MPAYPLQFMASQPTAYDSLGLIEWELPRAWCPEHNVLNPDEIAFHNHYYDGYSWQYPVCVHCGRNMSVYAYPVALDERRAYLRKNKAAWNAYIETHYIVRHLRARTPAQDERLYEEQKDAHLGVRLPWMIEQGLP